MIPVLPPTLRVSTDQFRLIVRGDRTTIRWPILPPPHFNALTQLWRRGATHWPRELLLPQITHDCPFIYAGRVDLYGPEGARRCIGGVDILSAQRLDDTLGSELMAEGFFNEIEFIADWDARWGGGRFAFANRPWVYVVRFHLLTREKNGICGRPGRGNPGSAGI